jgi:methyl coenzyme M reductase subunit D
LTKRVELGPLRGHSEHHSRKVVFQVFEKTMCEQRIQVGLCWGINKGPA